MNKKPNPKSLANLKPFPKGQSGNPGGSTVGYRRKLQGKFLEALSEDFEKHGKDAIVKMREETPAAYIKAIASLMPKEIEVSRPLEDMSDDELIAAVEYLRNFVAQGNGSGAESTAKPKAH